MKIKTKKFASKKMIIAVVSTIIALLFVAGALTYVYAFDGNLFGWKKHQNTVQDNGTTNYNPATTEQQKAGAKAKSGSSDTPPAPTTIPGSNKKNVQITITAANQNESTLQIRTLISTVENTGVCTLTLTSTGQSTVTKTANSQALASTSTCQGFDVPMSELSTGTWHILVGYSSSTLTGSANQDKVLE